MWNEWGEHDDDEYILRFDDLLLKIGWWNNGCEWVRVKLLCAQRRGKEIEWKSHKYTQTACLRD